MSNYNYSDTKAPEPEKATTPETSKCHIPGYADLPTTDENAMSDTVGWWPKVVPAEKS